MIDFPPRPMVERPADAPPTLEAWRCAGCGRLVAKIADVKGRIEIRCRCGTMNVLIAR